MKSKNKKLTALLVALFLTAGMMVQAVPTPPHEVYGTVTDIDTGEVVEGVVVDAMVDGEVVDTDTTDSDGYYSVRVSSDHDKFYLIVDDDTERENVEVVSGLDNYDVEKDLIEDDDPEDDEDVGRGRDIFDEPVDEPEEPDPEPEKEPLRLEETFRHGSATAEFTDVSANQEIELSLSDTEEKPFVRRVSFSSVIDRDTLDVSVVDMGDERPETVSPASEQVYRYQEINLGLRDIDVRDVEIEFTVDQEFLEERGRDPEDVMMKRYSTWGWEELETSLLQVEDEDYRFLATADGFSYFAITLEEEEGVSDIEFTGLKVEPEEGKSPLNVSIEADVENYGNISGTEEMEIKLNNETLVSESFTLLPGERESMALNHTIEDIGEHSFQAGDFTRTVEVYEETEETFTGRVGRIVYERSDQLALLSGAVLLVVLMIVFNRMLRGEEDKESEEEE